MRRLLAVLVLCLSLPAMASASVRSHADGLGSCSSGPAPYGLHGSCGTFHNANTWFGTHGPGFPTPLGWGLCAVPAAHGGFYPAPGYKYVPTTAPAGATTTSLAALGWAFSEAQRRNWWNAGNGASFSANDLGVAAKLLYDSFAWQNPLPTSPAPVVRALQALQSLVVVGRTITATPNLTVQLQGGGTTLATSGALVASLLVPSTNAPLAGGAVTLTLTNATFDATGTATQTVTTAADGTATALFHTTSGSPSTVTVAASTTVAVPGLLFYGPSIIALNAQVLATPRAPVALTSRLALTSTGTPRGTLTIVKSVDDPVYLGPADATFQVIDSANAVVATLVTGPDGTTGTTDALVTGTYVIHELTPPTGYNPAPDQTVTVIANTLTTVTIGPAEGDTAITGSVHLTKVDRTTLVPLAGAVFTLTYDTMNSGVADGTPLSCTTDTTGLCAWDNLLPGWYELVETSPPLNFSPAGFHQWLEVGPGASVVLTIPNDPVLVTVNARKFNATTDVVIPDATYDLYAATPEPPGAPAHLPVDAAQFEGYTWFDRGTTDAHGVLNFAVRAGYTWCLHEVSAPAGYIIDPGLHCTTTSSGTPRSTLSLPEVHSAVSLTVHKFSAANPNEGVPHATYALFVMHDFPAGFTAPPTPEGLVVPTDGTLWAIDDTNAAGQLQFSVPSGFTWCVQELSAPSDYLLDTSLHCTASAVTSSSPSSVTVLAVPEILAVTGSTPWWPWGLALLGLGVIITTRATRRCEVDSPPSRSTRPSPRGPRR